MCCGPFCARNRCEWTTCTLALSLLLLGGGAWLTKSYIKPALVYHDIICKTTSSTVEGLRVGVPMMSSTKFTLNIEMGCMNPNPYAVHLISRASSPVFLGSYIQPVGTAMELPPDSVLPAGGESLLPVFAVHASIEIDTVAQKNLLPQLAPSGGFPMYIDMNQTLKVEHPLALTTVRFAQRFEKHCGIMIAGLGSDMFKHAGHLACADSATNLTVPPLRTNHSAAGEGVLRFAVDQIAPETLREGMQLEQGALGIAMGIMYTAALALMLWSCFLFCFHGRCDMVLRRRSSTSFGKLVDNSDESDAEAGCSDSD
eukprot:TRINITY_DN80184_c0_g1_i1.p1 TRINITY_DN80184_c0_g1~~TRINITY_DN80184_c0_g1_i1.p1  ORF type:complete len:313 (+),score=30.43 TRINITY_DN80184_c0_g1_i1:110-1048(+)